MQPQLDIATATGVDVSLNIAGPGARSYAFVIDWHIRLLVALAWYFSVSLILYGTLWGPEDETYDEQLFSFAVMLPALAIYGLYHIVLEVVMRGRTPGKRIAGVRVTTLEGHEPGMTALIIRNVLRLVDSVPVGYVVGLAATLFSRNSVRIGDMAAGTVLVYESGAGGNAHDDSPASAEAVARFGLEKTELAQDLLARWEMLDSDKRRELAARVLAQLDPDEYISGSDVQLHARLKKQLGELGTE